MLTMIKKLWKEESGQGMTEYGLILALIVIAVIAIMATMGGNLKNKFTTVSDELAKDRTN
ncbi:Flp/Fap pilin component [Thermincola ferriacetica]|uniref:Flp/Fap pilin component n=1 Tax=Thermincola ferriacetica TaxID=281456 RepID=A0A0L6W4Q1_9FIRM|nr:Flp family type IVb pilin [Thermincola ferriacetica]KNZ70079.1 Flp/Fap pilin component [Thermincola ferriacetica]